MIIKCNLCEQTFELMFLVDWSRVFRHELGRHTKHIVYSERDGTKSKPMGNFTYGNVEWTTQHTL